MTLGEILSDLLQKRLNRDEIQIKEKVVQLEEAFILSSKLDKVTIAPILLITDAHPRSLIAIAYAFRLAEAIVSNLFVMTQGFHDELIIQEAKDLNINMKIIQPPRELNIPFIEDFVNNNDIGLIILPFNHILRERIQISINTAILATKIQRFVK